MTPTSELSALGAVELREGLRARRFSACEVVDAVLERSEDLAAEFNPFIEVLAERARNRARDEDHRIRIGTDGALSGVPISVKDHIWVAGTSSKAGSHALGDFRASDTCVAVRRLEEAGGIVFAKTTQSELGYMAAGYSPVHGRTSNPWNPSRSPGGSSAGAAVCVATGLGPIAIGSDGGGSIRIPAAFCGVVGFKPSFGLVPREPGFAGWHTLNAIGPLARSAADARLALEVMAGPDPRDRYSGMQLRPASDIDLRALRVVASEDLGTARVDEDVCRTFHGAVDRLGALGVTVTWDDPTLAPSGETWTAIAASESRFLQGALLESGVQSLGDDAYEFLKLGERFALQDYLSAEYARDEINSAYVELLGRHNAVAILTPTMGTEAFGVADARPNALSTASPAAPWDDCDALVVDASLAGLPACAIPIGSGATGLPVSLQVVGLHGDDSRVLAIAEAFELAIPHEDWSLSRMSR